MTDRTLREKIAALHLANTHPAYHIGVDDALTILDAHTAEQPAPDAVAEEWREIEQAHQPRLNDGYTAVRVSKPGFWLVKGPGPATAFAKGSRT